MAPEIWNRLGSRELDCYVEPLCGSAAVFLARPQPVTGREVLADYDPLLVNAWRSIQRAPDVVAEICCGMLRAESLLHGVHIQLTKIRDVVRQRIERNPEYYDVELGAWWIWGLCMKLGGGWCSGEGPWHSVDGKLICLEKDDPRRDGNGITRSVPCVTARGVLCQELSYLKAWMRALSNRLKNALILNGDWSRAVTPDMLGSGTIGIMFDPPYGAEAGYTGTLYTNQDPSISTKIKDWCAEHGTNRNMRIAYCGYSPEGDILERNGWSVHRWKARGGYGNAGQANKAKTNDVGEVVRQGNRFRERVWLNPTCQSNRHLMGDINFAWD